MGQSGSVPVRRLPGVDGVRAGRQGGRQHQPRLLAGGRLALKGQLELADQLAVGGAVGRATVDRGQISGQLSVARDCCCFD